jgi:hypothetical protein
MGEEEIRESHVASRVQDLSDYCVIRNLSIEDAFYTYCANHPHRNPRKLTLPIGAVFVGDSFGNRMIWKPSLETEEIRLRLLELLKSIREEPKYEYPFGFRLDEVVILQLGEFREKRAVEDLKRIAAFKAVPSPAPLFTDNRRTVEAAKTALQQIAEKRD